MTVDEECFTAQPIKFFIQQGLEDYRGALSYFCFCKTSRHTLRLIKA